MKLYMDEAGRGPLYGPLHIGLIGTQNITKKELKSHPLFKDSKALTPKKREKAFKEILELEKKGKIFFEIGSIGPDFIDTYGITRSIHIAVLKALYRLILKLNGEKPKKKISISEVFKVVKKFENEHEKLEIVFDGKSDFGIGKEIGIATETIVHGDASCIQISMASILAKVSRDALLDNDSLKFPNYGFSKHKGYGTKLHYNAINTYGVLPGHRKLFLKKIYPDRKIRDYDNKLPFLIN